MPKTKRQPRSRAARRRTQAQYLGYSKSNRSLVEPDQGYGEGKIAPMSSNQANSSVMIRELNLFGLRTRRHLRYQESISTTGSAGAVAGYVFSANGLYDPNFTGTGHQPMGFDQMMIFYDHYTVLRSSLTAVWVNLTTTQMIKVGTMVASGPTMYSTNYQTNLEAGGVNYTTLSVPGGWNSTAVQRVSCDLGKYQGVQQPLDNPDLRGDVSNNPAEQTYYILLNWNSQNSAVPSYLVDVIIDFDVVFHEPKLPTQS